RRGAAAEREGRVEPACPSRYHTAEVETTTRHDARQRSRRRRTSKHPMPMQSSRYVLGAAMAVGAALLATDRAAADIGYVPPSGDAQATSLFKIKDAVKSNFTAAGLKFKVGHAEIVVDAAGRNVRAG